MQDELLNLDANIGDHLNISSDSLKAVPIWRFDPHSGLAAHQEYFRGLGRHALTRSSLRRRSSVRRMVSSSQLAQRPGESETYSDVGYLMLEMVCESVNESLTTAWRKLPNHADEALHFRPIGEPGEPTNVAATERCPWRQRLLRGEVHDDNCWTMGGVAGHAGLFGRLRDVHGAGQAWLTALVGGDSGLGVDTDLVQRMVDPGIMHRKGTRVLGWDTPSPGRSSAGRYLVVGALDTLASRYLWIDPDAEVVVTVLSNRVCPSRDDTESVVCDEIHDLVRTILGEASPTPRQPSRSAGRFRCCHCCRGADRIPLGPGA